LTEGGTQEERNSSEEERNRTARNHNAYAGSGAQLGRPIKRELCVLGDSVNYDFEKDKESGGEINSLKMPLKFTIVGCKRKTIGTAIEL